METVSPFLLTRLIDASVDGIFAFDRGFRLVAWNRAMERISGRSREEVLGKSVLEVYPFLHEGHEGSLLEALAGKESVCQHHPYGRSDGEAFECRYTPLVDENNNIIGGIAIITDITARKQAEEAVHAAYSRLAFHVDSSPLAVVEWDSDFRVSRWSKSAERLFGWKARK